MRAQVIHDLGDAGACWKVLGDLRKSESERVAALIELATREAITSFRHRRRLRNIATNEKSETLSNRALQLLALLEQQRKLKFALHTLGTEGELELEPNWRDSARDDASPVVNRLSRPPVTTQFCG
jgi:hypothetical protein